MQKSSSEEEDSGERAAIEIGAKSKLEKQPDFEMTKEEMEDYFCPTPVCTLTDKTALTWTEFESDFINCTTKGEQWEVDEIKRAIDRVAKLKFWKILENPEKS